MRENIQRSTENGTAEVRASLEERSGEAVGPATKVATLRDNRHLILVVGNDLRELILDVLGVDGVSTKSGEHTSSKTKKKN